jgi:hypothetical protein
MKCLSSLFASPAIAALSIAMVGCSETSQPATATDAAPAAEHADASS